MPEHANRPDMPPLFFKDCPQSVGVSMPSGEIAFSKIIMSDLEFCDSNGFTFYLNFEIVFPDDHLFPIAYNSTSTLFPPGP